MNNFNDYYDYLVGNSKTMPNNIPTPNTSNYSNSMNFDNNMFQNTFMNLEEMPKLYNAKEGFTKGNMFANLYESYKNYKPMPIVAKSERESLLEQIQMHKFAMNDLVLYLDVNPRNSSLIKTYNDYLVKSKELVNQYEKMYGPLCNDSMIMPTNDWIWNNSPWPWEVGK